MDLNVRSQKQDSKMLSFFNELKKNRPLFVMAFPGFVLFLILNYVPMAGVLIAFKDMTFFTNNFIINFFQSNWSGFENFKFILQSPDAFVITRNTLLYNLSFIILGNIFSVTIAIMLDELRNKYALKFYQGTMLLPYFMSWIVMSYVLYAFLNPDLGFINSVVLKGLGLDPVMWYQEMPYWPFLLFLMNTLKYGGYNAVIYLAAITSIDVEYYEAAVIDGAGKLQQITKITLPLLSGIIIAMMLLGVGRIFNADFGLFFQVPMESGALFDVTNVLDTYVYRALRSTGDIGMSSAAGLYQSVMGFIFIITANFLVKKYDTEKAMF